MFNVFDNAIDREPALASRSNSLLYTLKSALVLTKDPAHLRMTYFLTSPKRESWGSGNSLQV